MMLSKIWERYFLKELFKGAFFFLICFYGLYVLIDYASHSSSFHKHHILFQWKEVFLYYFCEFAKRLEILLPFALLLSLIRTLCTLNRNNELIALMTSGISIQLLMRPFILFGFFCTLLLYINEEFVLPTSMKHLKYIDDSRSMQKAKHHHKAAAQHLTMDDHSLMVFQRFDPIQNLFFDVFWIRNVNDIYRIKHLKPNTTLPGQFSEGQVVDHLKRNERGELIVMESFEKKAFPQMRFNKQVLMETIMTPEEQSMSELWAKLPSLNADYSEKESRLLASFYHKLVLPWICLLALMGPAPYCLQSNRNLPIFFIYAASIFSLFAFFVVLDAAVLLGERQTLPPFWAIFSPFLIVSSLITWRFLKIRT